MTIGIINVLNKLLKQKKKGLSSYMCQWYYSGLQKGWHCQIQECKFPISRHVIQFSVRLCFSVSVFIYITDDTRM